MSRLTPHAELKSVAAVVNAASGSVPADASDRLEAKLGEFGLAVRVFSPAPADIASAVEQAVAARPDLLIVWGGDGTAGLAAQACGAEGPLLICLPGGTMNMLPFALHGRRSWDQVLEASLTTGRIEPVSGGEIDGRPFYVAAILGAPALWAKAREAVRKHDLRRAWLRAVFALKQAFGGRLRFSLENGPRQKAEALTLMCPLVSTALDRDAQALEAAILDVHGAGEAFRLGFNMVTGDWRRDPAVRTHQIRSGRVWARGRVTAILDGETMRCTHDLDIRFLPVAFRALVAREEAV